MQLIQALHSLIETVTVTKLWQLIVTRDPPDMSHHPMNLENMNFLQKRGDD